MHEFTTGGVIRLTVELVRRHAGPLLILFLLLGLVPDMAYTYIVAQMTGAGLSRWVPLAAILTSLSGILLQIAAIRIVIGAGPDRTPTVGDSLGVAARLFLPTLAIYLLSYMALTLAAILLVFPALMLACRWAVVLPTEVVERSGVFEPFRRSTALTQGSRWRIFGLLLIFAVVTVVVSLLGPLSGRFLFSPGQFVWITIIYSALSGSFFTLLVSVGAASIYLELRRAKEGFLSQNLVAVFD